MLPVSDLGANPRHRQPNEWSRSVSKIVGSRLFRTHLSSLRGCQGRGQAARFFSNRPIGQPPNSATGRNVKESEQTTASSRVRYKRERLIVSHDCRDQKTWCEVSALSSIHS